MFVRVVYKMEPDREVIVEFQPHTFVTVKDVLERFQNIHSHSTLFLLTERGRLMDGDQFVENARSYTMVRKVKQ